MVCMPECDCWARAPTYCYQHCLASHLLAIGMKWRTSAQLADPLKRQLQRWRPIPHAYGQTAHLRWLRTLTRSVLEARGMACLVLAANEVQWLPGAQAEALQLDRLWSRRKRA